MWMKVLKFGAIGIVLLLVIGRVGLPHALNALGFHPHFEVPEMDLSGKRALIVATSHDTLGDSGKATGVVASELTAPYYAFIDSGMDVDIASIQGGQIPVDPATLQWPVVSVWDKRYLKDVELQAKVSQSGRIDEVEVEQYDIVFLAGGWGAAYDFAQSPQLGSKVAAAYENNAIIGGVCHGPLGLLQAYDEDDRLIVEGRRISAVTDKQIAELGISETPKHPERDLRAAGVVFEANSAFRDIFANKVVVDGRIVTGQNQNSGTETAVKMMQVLIGETEGAPTS